VNKTLILLATGTLALAACGSSDDAASDIPETAVVGDTTAPATDTQADTGEGTDDDPGETDLGDENTTEETPDDESVDTTDAADPQTTGSSASSTTCEETAALFAAGPSVNPDLADPESSATCTGEAIVITSNGIPDYTYIQTSPGDPDAADLEFVITATPEHADETTAIPLLGSAAVSLTGVPIYGPTEGTGGDVLSLVGALSECGSHNGPTGFHIHLLGTSENTDCLFTPDEVAEAPQLVGYAFDGYPIYTGNDQYTSSWQLTDESLFATDTWAAHSYVEGSGDLDECNGLTDADGNYAYYTTDTFPYVLGCYSGVVDLDAVGSAGGGNGDGPGDGQGPPPGDG
jgi:YHYH protein